MANKQNLPNRVAKANAISDYDFYTIVGYTKDGKVKTVFVPGSNAKRYFVVLRRNGKQLTTELFLEAGNELIKTECTRQITYHCLAVCQIAAKEQGYKIVWAANYEDAKNLSNLGGRVFKVSAFDNPTSIMWGVMKEK